MHMCAFNLPLTWSTKVSRSGVEAAKALVFKWRQFSGFHGNTRNALILKQKSLGLLNALSHCFKSRPLNCESILNGHKATWYSRQ